MLTLLLFSLITFGLTTIITISKIGYFWRELAEKTHKKLGELFRCPMCMGFWVGLGLSFWISPTEHLFLPKGESSFAIIRQLLLDGILGSSVSWLLYCVTWKLALKDHEI